MEATLEPFKFKSMKSSFIFSQLLLALAVVSCSVEDSAINSDSFPSEKNLIQINAKASLDSKDNTSETRTIVGSLSNGQYQVTWASSGEVLRVVEDIDGTAKDYISSGYTRENSNKTAVFSFSVPENNSGNNYNYYAIYPSYAYRGVNIDNKYAFIYLKPTQKSAATSADATSSILFGSHEGLKKQSTALGFSLSHLAAYWKIAIKNLPLQSWETVQSITISASGKDIAGGADYYFNTGKITPVTNSKVSEITVTKSSTSGNFDFYMASWPVSFSSGNSITVSVKTDGNTYSRTISLSKAMIFEKGKMSKLTINMATAQSSNKYVENGIYLGEGVEIDGTVWAPVNCGYNSKNYPYGKMFQWGRPVGSGYSTTYDAKAFTPVKSTVSHSDAASESNAFNFYYTGVSPYDWLATQDDTIWNQGTEDNPQRTKYNPCPSGWRVPTQTEISALRAHSSGWTQNNGLNGRWFSGSNTYSTKVPAIFLSAAGWISYADAKAGGRTESGRYWTSTPSSSGAQSLRFDTSGSSIHAGSRSSAFSVRCVKVN